MGMSGFTYHRPRLCSKVRRWDSKLDRVEAILSGLVSAMPSDFSETSFLYLDTISYIGAMNLASG